VNGGVLTSDTIMRQGEIAWPQLVITTVGRPCGFFPRMRGHLRFVEISIAHAGESEPGGVIVLASEKANSAAAWCEDAFARPRVDAADGKPRAGLRRSPVREAACFPGA